MAADGSDARSAATVFRVRNIVSGLFVPTSVRDAVPLTFATYAQANAWLTYSDVREADFQIEEVEDDGQR